MVPHREKDSFFICICHNMHWKHDKCLIRCHKLYFIIASLLFMHNLQMILRTCCCCCDIPHWFAEMTPTDLNNAWVKKNHIESSVHDNLGLPRWGMLLLLPELVISRESQTHKQPCSNGLPIWPIILSQWKNLFKVTSQLEQINIWIRCQIKQPGQTIERHKAIML